jgi:signal transduction histidine kinase
MPRRETGEPALPAELTIAAAAVVMGAVTAVVTATGNDASESGAATLRAVSVVLPVVVGLGIWSRLGNRRFGQLLMLGGCVTFVAALSSSDSELVYSIGRVASWAAELMVVWLVLAFPSGRLRATADRVLVRALGVLIAVLFLPSVLLTDAFAVPSTWTTCTDGCPGNAFQVVGHEPAWVGDVLIPLRELLVALVLIAVTVRLWRRIAGATVPLRRTLSPVLAVAILHSVALPAAFGLRRADSGSDFLLDLSWVLSMGLPLVALGFLFGAARWRWAIGDAVYRLMSRLHARTDPGELRALIAEALHDPSAELVYHRPAGGWQDDSGRPVALPEAGSGQAYTILADEGEPIAAIVHDDALREQRSFVTAIGNVALMGLVNQRLALQVDESLLEVERSRDRILAAADDERRRIERDLHDGAQQRLVALRIKLELASESAAAQDLPDAELLRRLGEDVAAALDDVRSLASGVYPPLLADAGLGDALRAVARRSPVPATVAAQGVRRHPQEVEAAVYFSCLEALQNAAKHAGAHSVSIVVSDDDELRFEVRDDGRGFDAETVESGRGLTNIRDRIAAVHGVLEIDSGERGTRIAATIPLGRRRAFVRSARRRAVHRPETAQQ